jgi:arginine exporter protein ArgO
VRLCSCWVYMKWEDSASTKCTSETLPNWVYYCTWSDKTLLILSVHGVRLCLYCTDYRVQMDWDSGCTECTWSDKTLLLLSVHGVSFACTECTWSEKTVLVLSVHGVRLCLYWVYMEWGDSACTECTWSKTLLTLSVRGETLRTLSFHGVQILTISGVI